MVTQRYQVPLTLCVVAFPLLFLIVQVVTAMLPLGGAFANFLYLLNVVCVSAAVTVAYMEIVKIEGGA